MFAGWYPFVACRGDLRRCLAVCPTVSCANIPGSATSRLPCFSMVHLLPRSQILRSEEHTSELQSRLHLVCRLLLEKKKRTPHDAVPAEPPEKPSIVPYTNRFGFLPHRG